MKTKEKLSIISISVAAVLLIATVLFMIFNMAYIYATGSFGVTVITIVVFAVILFVIVKMRGNDGKRASIKLALTILCVLMLVVPIRGFVLGQRLANPTEDIQVELVECKTDYEYSRSYLICKLKFSNNTDVDLAGLSGKLSFYDGDKFIVTYDVFAGRINSTDFSSSTPMTSTFELADEQLYQIDPSNLRITYTFESICAGIRDFECEPKEVTLK